MFRTIDSVYFGPYPLRIEQEINQFVADLYNSNPQHYVVLATRYTPEMEVDYTNRWPRVFTLLQRDETGDCQLLFAYRDEQDKVIALKTWLLNTDEIQLAWLSYPFENDN